MYDIIIFFSVNLKIYYYPLIFLVPILEGIKDISFFFLPYLQGYLQVHHLFYQHEFHSAIVLYSNLVIIETIKPIVFHS